MQSIRSRRGSAAGTACSNRTAGARGSLTVGKVGGTEIGAEGQGGWICDGGG